MTVTQNEAQKIVRLFTAPRPAVISLATLLVKLHDQDGGFTYSPRRGNLRGTRGVAVTLKEIGFRGPHLPFFPVLSFIARYIANLKSPDLAFGGWNDKAKNRSFLSVTRVVIGFYPGLMLAYSRREQKVYDLEHCREIPVERALRLIGQLYKVGPFK